MLLKIQFFIVLRWELLVPFLESSNLTYIQIHQPNFSAKTISTIENIKSLEMWYQYIGSNSTLFASNKNFCILTDIKY